jgi:ankyrin repeat protein
MPLQKRSAIIDHILAGDVQKVKDDIKRKVDIEMIDQHFRATPLMLALENQQDEIVDLLIAAKASVRTILTHTGNTPLLVASKGSLHGLRAVLAARPSYISGKLGTPIMNAANLGLHANMIALLEDKPDRVLDDIEDDLIEQNVFMGIFSRDSPQIDEITELLIRKLPDPRRILNDNGVGTSNVLHCAAEAEVKGKSAEFASALRRVIPLLDPKALNVRGHLLSMSPVAAAARARAVLVLKILIESGADTSVTSMYERSPLLTMAVNAVDEDIDDAAECARMLVEAKADVNAKDSRGLSAIDIAVKNDCLLFAKVLVGLGAAPEYKDDPEIEKMLKAEQQRAEKAKEGGSGAKASNDESKQKPQGKSSVMGKSGAKSKVDDEEAYVDAKDGNGGGGMDEEEEMETVTTRRSKRKRTPKKHDLFE